MRTTPLRARSVVEDQPGEWIQLVDLTPVDAGKPASGKVIFAIASIRQAMASGQLDSVTIDSDADYRETDELDEAFGTQMLKAWED